LESSKVAARTLQSRTLVEKVIFRGHPLVSALHPRTIEVTRDEGLTERGDCIVGVEADRGCAGLSDGFKHAMRRDGAEVSIVIGCGKLRFAFSAMGAARLELSDVREMVIRKSVYVSPRTLAVGSNAGAADIPRGLVHALKNPEAVGFIELEVRV